MLILFRSSPLFCPGFPGILGVGGVVHQCLGQPETVLGPSQGVRGRQTGEPRLNPYPTSLSFSRDRGASGYHKLPHFSRAEFLAGAIPNGLLTGGERGAAGYPPVAPFPSVLVPGYHVYPVVAGGGKCFGAPPPPPLQKTWPGFEKSIPGAPSSSANVLRGRTWALGGNDIRVRGFLRGPFLLGGAARFGVFGPTSAYPPCPLPVIRGGRSGCSPAKFKHISQRRKRNQ
jgi:hypothetical protein